MSIQTELTRITNAKAAIKAAVEGKGVTVPDGTLLDGMASLIESIEAGGGGSSWTDSYSVFATGTFTPTENSRKVTIDTGIPFDSSNYLSQFLMIWREPDMTTLSGFYIGTIRASADTNSGTHMGIVVGSSAGTNTAAPLKQSNSSYPTIGDSVWSITGISSTAISFRGGKSYRWLLLGALK